MTTPTWISLSTEELFDESAEGRVGVVTTTREKIEAVFGAPSFEDPQGTLADCTVEWDLKFSDGTVATIYDFNIGEDGPVATPGHDDMYEWHIGGTSELSAQYVIALLS